MIMILEPNLFLKTIIALAVIMLTEFIIRIIVYIRLFSIFPNQKYKTIRKKVITNKPFFEKYKLFYILNYDNSIKTKLSILICYFYRIYALYISFEIVFVKLPTLYSEELTLFWEIMLIIPSVIWLKKIRKYK